MICYLDNAATTKVIAEAQQAAVEMMDINFCNPSAVHAGGAAAHSTMQTARGAVAQAMGVLQNDVIFTGSGTEATNTALFGAAFKNKHHGRHIVSTMIEHDATLNTLMCLKAQGYEITLIKPKKDGNIDLEQIESAIRQDTILLSMMAVNNETGAVLPYAEGARLLKKKCPHGLVHVDAVQAFCKTKIDTQNCDLITVSAHKIGGLKGVGGLYIKQGVSLRPYIYGGGQEGGMRSGTENLPGIAAFGAAAQARFAHMEQGYAHMSELKQRLLAELSKSMDYSLNSPENSVPYIINLSPRGSRSEIYIRMLSDAGVYVAGGSACARGKKSHVLAAMELPKAVIDSALRISLCPETTIEEIDMLVAELPKIWKMLV